MTSGRVCIFLFFFKSEVLATFREPPTLLTLGRRSSCVTSVHVTSSSGPRRVIHSETGHFESERERVPSCHEMASSPDIRARVGIFSVYLEHSKMWVTYNPDDSARPFNHRRTQNICRLHRGHHRKFESLTNGMYFRIIFNTI